MEMNIIYPFTGLILAIITFVFQVYNIKNKEEETSFMIGFEIVGSCLAAFLLGPAILYICISVFILVSPFWGLVKLIRLWK